MDGQQIALLDLDENIKGRRRAAFQNGFLGAAPPGFLIDRVTDRYRPPDQKGGIEEQIFKRAAVSGPDQLDTPLGNGAGGDGFELAADLIDHDHFGVVVFDRFDHHFVLKGWGRNLHAAGFSNGRVRHIAVTADFVGGIDDDDALGFGQHTGRLAQHGRFADAGFTRSGGFCRIRPGPE